MPLHAYGANPEDGTWAAFRGRVGPLDRRARRGKNGSVRPLGTHAGGVGPKPFRPSLNDGSRSRGFIPRVSYKPETTATTSGERTITIQIFDLLRSDSAETKPENDSGRKRICCLPSAVPASGKIFSLERPNRHKSCPVHVQTAAET